MNFSRACCFCSSWATTVLFGSVLLLLWLSGHIAFIKYYEDDEDG